MLGLVNRTGTLIHGQMRALFKGWKSHKIQDGMSVCLGHIMNNAHG